MISVAWCISLLLCTPQAFIFQGDKCQASFAPGWGLKAYIAWFSISNFFVPLVILFFCYSRICYDIWENGKGKKNGNNGFLRKIARQRSRDQESTKTRDETIATDDPNAILAIEKLQRRPSTSSDSSIDSNDQKVSVLTKILCKVLILSYIRYIVCRYSQVTNSSVSRKARRKLFFKFLKRRMLAPLAKVKE